MIEQSEQLVVVCDICGLVLEIDGQIAHFDMKNDAEDESP